MKFILFLVFFLLPWLLFAGGQADLIVKNAKLYTMEGTPLGSPQSIAILGDKIVAVGSDADVDSWNGAGTKIIDAQGKLVLPGFNDSHVHFVSGGQQLTNVNLKDASTREEFIRRIAERVKQTADKEWILGGAIGMINSGIPQFCPPKNGLIL